MRLTTTLLLLVFILFAGAFIYLYERHQSTTSERVAQEGILTRFIPEEIESVQIAISGGQSVRISKDDDQIWRLDRPEQERAAPDWVEEILETAAKLEIVETIQKEELQEGTMDSAAAGFGSGSTRLRLTPKGKDPINILFGSAAPFENTAYVVEGAKLTPDRPIHIVQPDLRELLSKESTERRDPQLLRADEEKITNITFRSEEGEFELKRQNAEEYWRITRPLQTRADRDQPDLLLELLLREKITTPATNVAIPAIDSAPLTVAVQSGSDAPSYELYFWPASKEEEPAFVRTSDRPDTYAVDARLVAALTLSPNDLRDPFLARIDPAALGGISISSANTSNVELNRQGDAWLLARRGQTEAANFGRIQELVTKLNEHVIRDFASDAATDLSQFGLETPLLELELRSISAMEKNAPESENQQSVNESVTLTLGKGADNKVYANYSNEPFIYRVGPDLLSAIPVDPVKWKGLELLRFSIFSLRGLTIEPTGQPPLTIKFDLNQGRWVANRPNQDVTELLDPVAAELFTASLSNFAADDWMADRIEGFKALQDPTLRIGIEIAQSPMGGLSPTDENFKIQLSFAPTSTGDAESESYYGQVVGVPEVFLISKQRYHELLSPLLSKPK